MNIRVKLQQINNVKSLLEQSNLLRHKNRVALQRIRGELQEGGFSGEWAKKFYGKLDERGGQMRILEDHYAMLSDWIEKATGQVQDLDHSLRSKVR